MSCNNKIYKVKIRKFKTKDYQPLIEIQILHLGNRKSYHKKEKENKIKISINLNNK